MTQPVDKRHTQFNFAPLRGSQPESPNPVPPATKPEPLQSGEKHSQPTKRDGASLQGPSRKLMKSPLRALTLPTIVDSGESVDKAVDVRKESPWNTFNKVYSCELAGLVTVVEPRCQPSKIFAIRKFPGDAREDIMQILGRVQHDNIISALKCFLTPDCLYVTFEHQPATLDHLVACRKWPSDIQLASIMAQVNNPSMDHPGGSNQN